MYYNKITMIVAFAVILSVFAVFYLNSNTTEETSEKEETSENIDSVISVYDQVTEAMPDIDFDSVSIENSDGYDVLFVYNEGELVAEIH